MRVVDVALLAVAVLWAGACQSPPVVTDLRVADQPVWSLALHGRMLAVGTGAGRVQIYRVSGEKTTAVSDTDVGVPVRALAFDSTGHRLALVGWEGSSWFDPPGVLAAFEVGAEGLGAGRRAPVEGGPNCLAFSPDGTLLVTGGLDGVVRRWSADSLESLDGERAPKKALKPEIYAISCLGVDDVVTGCADGRVFDSKAATWADANVGPVPVCDLAIGDGVRVYAGGLAPSFSSNDSVAWEQEPHQYTLAVRFAAKGRILVALSTDGARACWRRTPAGEYALVGVDREEVGRATSLAVARDGSFSAVGYADGRIRIRPLFSRTD